MTSNDIKSTAIPDIYKICPDCAYNLVGTIDGGLRRCPECGREFTVRELRDLGSDPNATPGSLRPDELRVSGRMLSWLFIGAVVIVAALVFGLLTQTAVVQY